LSFPSAFANSCPSSQVGPTSRVANDGSTHWTLLSGKVSGFSSIQKHVPIVFIGRWTPAEDALLLTSIRKHGRHWYRVAELLPGRTDDQCAKRWREKLDPSIRKLTILRISRLVLTSAVSRS
jgi:hypothetical protein